MTEPRPPAPPVFALSRLELDELAQALAPILAHLPDDGAWHQLEVCAKVKREGPSAIVDELMAIAR